MGKQLFAYMAQQRGRDRVWKFALQKGLRTGEPVTVDYIVEASGVSERTARECLNVIAECGWLNRTLAADGSVRFVAPTEPTVPPSDRGEE